MLLTQEGHFVKNCILYKIVILKMENNIKKKYYLNILKCEVTVT